MTLMVTSIIREIIYKARPLTENENKINSGFAAVTVIIVCNYTVTYDILFSSSENVSYDVRP